MTRENTSDLKTPLPLFGSFMRPARILHRKPAKIESMVCGYKENLMSHFPRRSSSRSTASRMKAGLPYVPAIASMRANTSGANRTGTGFRLSGGRPMRGSVAGAFAVRKKTILFLLTG